MNIGEKKTREDFTFQKWPQLMTRVLQAGVRDKNNEIRNSNPCYDVIKYIVKRLCDQNVVKERTVRDC